MTQGPAGSEPSIVQYWHSEQVPAEIAEMTVTFRDLNPDMHHQVFCEEEARVFIADRYTSREVAAFDACAVPAMQADYFRYCAILALGGIYCDADFRCLQPLHQLSERTQGGLLFRREPQGNLVNGFFVFAAPGHLLLRLALEVATVNIERREVKRVNVATGPWVFTVLAALHRAGSMEAMREIVVGKSAERVEPIMEAIGDYERLSRAFEDIRIESFEAAKTWIGRSHTAPSHKLGDGHWVRWHEQGKSIFR